MRTLLLSLLLATGPAVALDDDYLQYSDTPAPPDAGDPMGLVDHMGVVIARPRLDDFSDGLTYRLLNTIVAEAMADREERYDFAVVVHTRGMPSDFTAAAFHLAYNNAELEGIGTNTIQTPHIRTRSVLWMNHLDYWESTYADHADWVFAHEVSHYWLARPRLPGHDPAALLGRQSAHWSYFMHTPNSPIEGNAWVDNKDGTFTTDLDVDPTFSELDLYLMGLAQAEEVPDFFYIADPANGAGGTHGETVDKDRTSQPQHIAAHYNSQGAVTVAGTRIDVSIEDLIAANGERRPTAADSPTHFRMLPIFIVTPTEVVESGHIERIQALTQMWSEAWSHYTRDRSTCSFSIDEAWDIPQMAAPVVVPKEAW